MLVGHRVEENVSRGVKCRLYFSHPSFCIEVHMCVSVCMWKMMKRKKHAACHAFWNVEGQAAQSISSDLLYELPQFWSSRLSVLSLNLWATQLLWVNFVNRLTRSDVSFWNYFLLYSAKLLLSEHSFFNNTHSKYMQFNMKFTFLHVHS